MKVIWTPEAQQDRADVWACIAADNPRAAARMDELFSDAAASLTDHPKLGRTGKIAGTRELMPHESYRLVYEIDGETVWIWFIRPASGHLCVSRGSLMAAKNATYQAMKAARRGQGMEKVTLDQRADEWHKGGGKFFSSPGSGPT